MFFVDTLETEGLGNRSYLAGGATTAVVVDPPRDVERVVAAAAGRGVRIGYVVHAFTADPEDEEGWTRQARALSTAVENAAVLGAGVVYLVSGPSGRPTSGAVHVIASSCTPGACTCEPWATVRPKGSRREVDHASSELAPGRLPAWSADWA